MKSKHSVLPFSLTAPYYDLMYEKRGIEETTRMIFHHAKALLPKRTDISVFDIGCGTGAYTLELWKQGAKITGIDQSTQMLEVAKKKAADASADIAYITGDFLSYKTPKTYDVAVSLFDVLSYMKTNREVEQFFRRAASILKPHGVFIFDCWYGPGVFLGKPRVVRQHYKNDQLEVFRQKIPKLSHATNTVDVHHTLTIRPATGQTRKLRETHTMRYFFFPELEAFTSLAGFRIVHWGNLAYSMRKPAQAPWSVWVIAQKMS